MKLMGAQFLTFFLATVPKILRFETGRVFSLRSYCLSKCFPLQSLNLMDKRAKTLSTMNNTVTCRATVK
jgi:hypothetical protein